MLSVLFECNLFLRNYLKAVQSGMLFKTNHILNGQEGTEYFLLKELPMHICIIVIENYILFFEFNDA